MYKIKKGFLGLPERKQKDFMKSILDFDGMICLSSIRCIVTQKIDKFTLLAIVDFLQDSSLFREL